MTSKCCCPQVSAQVGTRQFVVLKSELLVGFKALLSGTASCTASVLVCQWGALSSGQPRALPSSGWGLQAVLFAQPSSQNLGHSNLGLPEELRSCREHWAGTIHTRWGPRAVLLIWGSWQGETSPHICGMSSTAQFW